MVEASPSCRSFSAWANTSVSRPPFHDRGSKEFGCDCNADVGVYTVQVSLADDGVGEVLVEVYEVTD